MFVNFFVVCLGVRTNELISSVVPRILETFETMEEGINKSRKADVGGGGTPGRELRMQRNATRSRVVSNSKPCCSRACSSTSEIGRRPSPLCCAFFSETSTFYVVECIPLSSADCHVTVSIRTITVRTVSYRPRSRPSVVAKVRLREARERESIRKDRF